MAVPVPAVELRGISKAFPGVVANAGIDFTVLKGEIHTLLGENGAGKSTLMNILYGLYSPDAGDILIDGRRVELKSPSDAIANRIGMIHQHFMLVPPLTVCENVALGMKDQSPVNLNLMRVERGIRELSAKYGLNVDPRAKVWQLSVGAQQRVEIIKALYRGADVLIMDEPTAVLTPQEVEELFVVLKELARQGCAIIFISHKLWEVLRISDRITVLRNGRKVSTVATADATKDALARMMVGREVLLQYDRPPAAPNRVILDIRDLEAADDKGLPALRGLSLQVRAGEVVGLAGVDGNGQRELAETIVGLRRSTAGRISLEGKDVTGLRPRDFVRLGVAHIPEDRHRTGLILDFCVADNMVLNTFDSPPFTARGFIRPEQIRAFAERLVAEFDVRCPSVATESRNLSGGNQQKVVLAREIVRRPRLLIAAQPTRGLDVGATEYVQKRLIAAREAGGAVLLISTDLDEILAVSDRVVVIYEGRVMGEFVPGEADFAEIGLMMAGSPRETPGRSAAV
ncbi:MAG: ABC transporter ATP-binding protein [Bacillota bacterium]